MGRWRAAPEGLGLDKPQVVSFSRSLLSSSVVAGPSAASISASTISSTRVPSVDPSSTQRYLHQENHRFRSGQNVSRAEAKQSVAGIDQTILTAVVGRQAFAMRRAVVLDPQTVHRVIQVRSSHEAPRGVAKRNLGLWRGQPGEYQEQPQPRFHDALSRRLGQLDSSPKTRHAWESRVRLEPAVQMAHFQKALMQRGIQHRHRVDDRRPARHVSQSADNRCDAQTMACRDLASAEFRSSDRNSGHVRSAAVRRKSHFDRVARWHVEPMKPGRRAAGENGRVREAPLSGGEDHDRVAGNLAPGVETGANPSPARTDEVVLRQPVPPCLLEAERPLRKCDRYPGSWRHCR